MQRERERERDSIRKKLDSRLELELMKEKYVICEPNVCHLSLISAIAFHIPLL